jgi:hypothetical protein
VDDLPPLPPGFRRTTGKRNPPRDGTAYHIQLRQGFVDTRIAYTADQLRWIWDGTAGDVVAVKNA